MILRAGIGLGCLFVACAAVAQQSTESPAYRFEVTPFAGFRTGGTFTDEDSGAELELNDSGSYGLILNMRESWNTEWELLYNHQSTDFDTGPGTRIDIDIDYLQIGGTYIGTDIEGPARPYLAATIGLAHLDPRAANLPSDTYFAFSIGGGWKFFPTSRLGLRLEGRFYGTVIDSDSKIFCASGPSGGTCLINTKADVLWQFELLAGAIVRF